MWTELMAVNLCQAAPDVEAPITRKDTELQLCDGIKNRMSGLEWQRHNPTFKMIPAQHVI